MQRLQTLKRDMSSIFECSARIITYSFATESTDVTTTQMVNMPRCYYRTCRLGSLPEHPTIMVANAGREGKWVANLITTMDKEHPVYNGWTKQQVTHSWLKQNGTIMVGTMLGQALECIVKRCYPALCVRSLVWQSLTDVVSMIGNVNDPTSLLGKIPSMACTRVVSPTLEQQVNYVLHLASTLELAESKINTSKANYVAMSRAANGIKNTLTDALVHLYHTPRAKELPQLEDVRQRHSAVHENACVLASLTTSRVKISTNQALVDEYRKGLCDLKHKLGLV